MLRYEMYLIPVEYTLKYTITITYEFSLGFQKGWLIVPQEEK